MQGVKKAFTLIELLIVITIIGILAVYLVPRIVGVPAKGRDAARIQAVNQIATALETYKSEHGKYPAAKTGACMNETNYIAIKNALGGQIPKDPQGTSADSSCTGGEFWYKTLQNETEYVLVANTEQDGEGKNGYFSFTKAKTLTKITDAFDNTACPVDGTCRASYDSAKDEYKPAGADNVYAIFKK